MAAAAQSSIAAAGLQLNRGEWSSAQQTCLRVLDQDPRNADALSLLALVLGRQGNVEQAITALVRALTIRPRETAWWQNLGTLQSCASQWSAAVESFETAMGLGRTGSELTLQYARALLHAGRLETSIEYAGKARQWGSDPQRCAHIGAEALSRLNRPMAAIALLEASVEGVSPLPKTHRMLASLHDLTGAYHRARPHWERVVEENPHDAMAEARLALSYWDGGDLRRSLTRLESAVRSMRTEDAGALESFYLSSLLHDAEQDGASLRAAHARWAVRHGAGEVRFQTWTNARQENRRLRLGYLTGEFLMCPSYHFLIPLFRHRNREEFGVFSFHLRDADDDATREYRALSDHWFDCRAMSDHDLLDLVRNSEIDIMVDLSGHYPGHRLALFDRKPAPVSVTFPNYPSTTGLGSFDGIIVDEWVCPSGAESQYSEPVCRLPSGYLPYAPPAEAPAVDTLPARTNGFITFGLFQRPVKISRSTWDAIAQVLREMPDSRLLIHNPFPELDVVESPMRQLYRSALSSRGVAADRLLFRGPAPMQEHLRILAATDIALDTFPYNGQTTTSECLWMGVPVVSVRGDYHVARVAYSILARAGCAHWAADDVAGYVRIATGLAADLARLSETRAGLRQRLRSSSLLRHAQTVNEIEAVYRRLWRNWCRSGQQPGEQE